MNKWMGMGRLTRDADIRQTTSGMKIASFTLAVDRRSKNGGADFLSCKAFDKTADFLERYGHKGTKFAVEGHIQTGSYERQDGSKVYTTDIVVDSIEFAESKNAQSEATQQAPKVDDSFVEVDDWGDLPFN